MITAVDTSVLLDVFTDDPRFEPGSGRALRSCIAEGMLVASDVVWSETSAFFGSPAEARRAMTRLGVSFGPLDEAAALAAGRAWRSYRRRGGVRDRIVSDFLVGAHAMIHADRLLTRDRGFYRAYFRRLRVLDPTPRGA